MSSKKVNKSRGEVLHARAKKLVKNYVRLMSMRWPYASEAWGRFRVERGVYECGTEGLCLSGVPDGRRLHGPRWVFQMDHTEPVVDPEFGRTTFAEYFRRALPESSEAFRVLCRACHRAKTERERGVRARSRRSEG